MLGSEHPIPLSQPTDPFLRQGITPHSISPTRSPFLSSTDPANNPMCQLPTLPNDYDSFTVGLLSLKSYGFLQVCTIHTCIIRRGKYAITLLYMLPYIYDTCTEYRSRIKAAGTEYRILECTNDPVPIAYICICIIQYRINPQPSRHAKFLVNTL